MRTKFQIDWDEPERTLTDMFGALVGLVVRIQHRTAAYYETVYVLRLDPTGDVVVCALKDRMPVESTARPVAQADIYSVRVGVGTFA